MGGKGEELSVGKGVELEVGERLRAGKRGKG